jgi:hypothetical protein
VTNAQGQYTLTGLYRTPYTVIAEAQRGQLRARQGEVMPDATVNLQTHAVTTLSGNVTGPTGPVELFTVALHGPSPVQRSFTQGHYAIDHLAPGRYTVYVESAQGGGSGEVTIDAMAPAQLDVSISGNGIVLGALIDPTGKPLVGARVVVVRDDDNPSPLVRPPEITRSDGRFRLEHVAGRAALIVDRAPERPFIHRGFVVEPGKTVDLGTLTVEPAPAPPIAPPDNAPERTPRIQHTIAHS